MTLLPMPLLSSIPGLSCLFVARLDEPRPDPERLLAVVRDADGEDGFAFVRARQVHSNRWVVVRSAGVVEDGGVIGEADALMTDLSGILLGIATADCVPLVAYDPRARVVAVIHAGWRGTVAGVLSEALSAMHDQLGADPGEMLVSAGPCAGVCCYRVGGEVIDTFAASGADMDRIVRRGASDASYLDLIEANRSQALAAGVRPDRFAAMDVCTICGPSELHSYRRDGAAAGRMWLLAGLTGRD